MTSKFSVLSLFGVGAISGGIVPFMPKSSPRDAKTINIYRVVTGIQERGDNNAKGSLIIGKKENNSNFLNFQNSNSVVRVGDDKLEHQSSSWNLSSSKKNYSFLLTGNNYLKDSSHWKKMNKTPKNSYSGSITVFLSNASDIDCNSITKEKLLNSDNKSHENPNLTLTCEINKNEITWH